MGETSEHDLEQRNLDTVYARLDALRAEATEKLADVRRTEVGGNHQNRSERDAFASLYEDQLLRMRGAEEGLCFGRIDLKTGDTTYIGRIGISDAQHHQLLMDWRAPASEPFYRATAANPGPVVRRRHLATSNRRITGIEDDVLDAAALPESARANLQGEGALMAALSAHRTGRMGDIVATIQSEQDEIIRKPLGTTVVVQGGPGTGKTAVALHRAAYLLYEHRARIAKSGVLIVGPTPVFLRYIEQVLPSLGETGAVLLTPGQLYPGIDTTALDAPLAAEVKGDLRMVKVLRKAVRAYQRVPASDQRLAVGRRSVTLTRDIVRTAMRRAREHSQVHNESRDTFAGAVVDALAAQLAPQGLDALSAEKRQEIYDDLRMSKDVKVAVNLCWLPLSARGVLDALLTKPAKLVAAADGILSLEEMAAIRRGKDAPTTVEDVPLLDEIAELIGTYTTARPATSAVDHDYAEAVLENTGTGWLLDADTVASRQQVDEGPETLSERAVGDREWTYGHLVVDEAQEMSGMQWRLLFRRVPGKSATVVGDLAQARTVDVNRSWSTVLAPHIDDRFELTELTVSYRTPAKILLPANALLRRYFPQLSLPTPVRDGEVDPWHARFDNLQELIAELPARVGGEVEAVGTGRVAVIVAAPQLELVEHALTGNTATRHSAEPTEGIDFGSGPRGIDHRVAVLSPLAAKGLEFDSVIIVEPGAIAPAGDIRGVGELYVALSRSTSRLGVMSQSASVLDDTAFGS